MSRQIYFYQTEVDMSAFFDVIRKNDAVMVASYFDREYSCRESVVINEIEELFQYLRQYSSVAVNLCPAKYICYLSNGCAVFPSLDCGASVEYGVCKINARGRRQGLLSPGRIYLPTHNQTCEYRPELQSLYQALYKFIRKNYIYEKEYSRYFAPDLLARVKAGEIQLSLNCLG